MTLWTFSNIKSKVRDILGLKSQNQLSESDLETAINQYYFYQFVLDAKPLELQDYWDFTTTANTDEYALTDSEIVTLSGDGYIGGYPLRLYLSEEEFYSIWPRTGTYTATRSTDALLYGGNLVLRATPDDAYAVKIPAFVRPTTFSLDSDTPTRQEWGPAIAYGTAHELLMAKGQMQRALEVESVKKKHIGNILYKSAEQLAPQRAMPRW